MNIKNKIINTTIELMKYSDSIEQLSIRKIASKAEIGTGLINYHFGSKEQLIKTSVRTFIQEKVISTYKPDIIEIDDLHTILTKICMGPVSFIFEYPKIASISILFDLENPDTEDNTAQTKILLYKAFKHYISEMNDIDLKMKVWLLVSIFHETFLRYKLFVKDFNYNLQNENGRFQWLKKIIKSIF